MKNFAHGMLHIFVGLFALIFGLIDLVMGRLIGIRVRFVGFCLFLVMIWLIWQTINQVIIFWGG